MASCRNGRSPTVTEADRARIEQAIAEAQLRPYQAMVIRQIAVGENMTAALDWIEQVREVSDGATTEG